METDSELLVRLMRISFGHRVRSFGELMGRTLIGSLFQEVDGDSSLRTL